MRSTRQHLAVDHIDGQFPDVANRLLNRNVISAAPSATGLAVEANSADHIGQLSARRRFQATTSPVIRLGDRLLKGIRGEFFAFISGTKTPIPQNAVARKTASAIRNRPIPRP